MDKTWNLNKLCPSVVAWCYDYQLRAGDLLLDLTTTVPLSQCKYHLSCFKDHNICHKMPFSHMSTTWFLIQSQTLQFDSGITLLLRWHWLKKNSMLWRNLEAHNRTRKVILPKTTQHYFLSCSTNMLSSLVTI